MICLLAVLFFRQAVAQPWEDLAGKEQASALAGDSWLVINYWALWCAPCRDEVPELNRLAEDSASVRVLGVNFDQPRDLDKARAARKQLGIDFPVLRYSPHKLYDQTLPVGLPATDLLAPGGIYRKRLLGPQTKAAIEEQIEKLSRELDQ